MVLPPQVLKMKVADILFLRGPENYLTINEGTQRGGCILNQIQERTSTSRSKPYKNPTRWHFKQAKMATAFLLTTEAILGGTLFMTETIYDQNGWKPYFEAEHTYMAHIRVYTPPGVYGYNIGKVWEGERGQNVKIGDWETHALSQTGLLWGVSELLSTKIVWIIFYSVQLQESRPQEFARSFFHAVFSRFTHERGTTGRLILHNLAHIFQSGRKTWKNHSAFFPEAWEMFSICTVNLSVMPNNQH